MNPGMGGYNSFQNRGRHGSVSEINAVGSRWMKAVAIKTPVPKCREKKMNLCGIGREGKRLAITGKAHATVLC